ncbi:unnamed protein product [Schistosoma curassoni]|uniref:Uncharacterized protein n=1 Tax=Schistosoma curassoni TaxID=6186 RepID=A0A3P7ZV79_9TREM|nr:unnamed protein product [Schistosoma curassoni]
MLVESIGIYILACRLTLGPSGFGNSLSFIGQIPDVENNSL